MKKAVKIILLVLSGFGWGLFFCPVVIYGVLNAGNGAGMLACGAVFLAVLFREKTKKAAARAWRRLPGKIALILLALCVLLGGADGVINGARIIKAAKNAPAAGDTRTVVVLGCRVYDSGPSRMLISRINAAYDYLAAHPEAKCILSGGQGEDEPEAEAQSMFNALTDLGIDRSRLIMEQHSTSTVENLAFSAEIIKERGLPESVALVTSEYHQYRASVLAAREGLPDCAAVSAASQKILLPTYFLREICCLIFMDLFQR